jgi:hypothetical protein
MLPADPRQQRPPGWGRNRGAAGDASDPAPTGADCTDRSKEPRCLPATPDRDTLRRRTPDRRPVAEAAKVIDRELARRPAAILADLLALATPELAV